MTVDYLNVLVSGDVVVTVGTGSFHRLHGRAAVARALGHRRVIAKSPRAIAMEYSLVRCRLKVTSSPTHERRPGWRVS